MALDSVETRRLKLGILIQDFQLGGSERVALRLASAWSRMGIRVVLFCGDDVGPQRHLVGDAIELEVADPSIRSGTVRSAIALGRWVKSRISAQGVDVLYLPGNSYFMYVNGSVAAGARVFVTITNLLWRPDRSWMRNVLFALLTRWRLRKAHGIASMSPSLLRVESALHGRSDVCEVLQNAVFDSTPDVHGAERRRWHLCAVGRLVPQKNFALLLRSFALLNDLPVTLSIVGDGPLRVSLEQLAVALGVAERVQFLGAVPHPARFISEAEVLLLTSAYEGYPAVAIEAIALGTFVIASDCSPAIADIVGSDAVGTVVPDASAEQLSRAVREYFSGAMRNQIDARRGVAESMAQKHASANAARAYLRFMGVGERLTETSKSPTRMGSPGIPLPE